MNKNFIAPEDDESGEQERLAMEGEARSEQMERAMEKTVFSRIHLHFPVR